MSHQTEAVFFDLDGTLLNTLDDLADACNAVLAAHGLARHPTDAYRFFVGDGMATLLRRAAGLSERGDPEEEALLQSLQTSLREGYSLNWARKTAPYPGILPMLLALRERGLPLAVLSNKPHEMTVLTVGHFFPQVDFAGVQGSPPGGKAKPDPALALELARSLAVPPERVLFLGDSSVDMDTANAAGMIAAGALWGFRPESELIAHGAKLLLRAPQDLLEQV